jgi:hypothetical protein
MSAIPEVAAHTILLSQPFSSHKKLLVRSSPSCAYVKAAQFLAPAHLAQL